MAKIIELRLEELEIPDYIASTTPPWANVFQKEILKWEKQYKLTPKKFYELCVEFGINYVYKDNPKVKSLLKAIKSGKSTESWKHRKEKIKLLLFLLDSGISPDNIRLEFTLPSVGTIPDLAVELFSFKANYLPFEIESNYYIEVKYFLACEAGDISKDKLDVYIDNGIPVLWAPYRHKFKYALEELSRKSFKHYYIKYYAHLLDESLFAILIIPGGGFVK